MHLREMYIFLIGTFIFQSGQIYALGEKSLCLPADKILAKIEDCQENVYFIEAGERCIKQLDLEFQVANKKLNKAFIENASQNSRAQNSKLNNIDQNLSANSNSLKELLAKSERAKLTLQEYLSGLVFPGNPSPKMLNDLNLREYLSDFWCYESAEVALKEKIDKLDTKIAQLKNAYTTNSNLSLANSINLGGLESIEIVPMNNTSRSPSSETIGETRNRSEISDQEPKTAP